MNAILQALSNTEGFTKYFLEKYDKNNDNKKFSKEIYNFLRKFWDPNNQSYDPKDFKNEISNNIDFYTEDKANDFKNLINIFLKTLHIENNELKFDFKSLDNYIQENNSDEKQTFEAFRHNYFSKNKSIIIDLFYSVYKAEVKYKKEPNTSLYDFKAYSFLEFPLKEVNNYMNQNDKKMKKIKEDGTNRDIDLDECFKYYNTSKNDKKMPCHSFDDKVQYIVQTSIYSLSPYLIILFDRGNDTICKCNIKFKETLEIFDYVSQKKTAMNLYAVICLLEESSILGNFIAYCKHRKTKEWYRYNDDKVEKCTEDKPYNNGMVYLLFYEKVEK